MSDLYQSAPATSQPFPPPPPAAPGRRIALILLVVMLAGSALLNFVLFLMLVGVTMLAGGPQGDFTEKLVAGSPDAARRILLIRVEGVIARGTERGSADLVASVRKRLAAAAEAEGRFAGILLLVNSPGGAVSASDEIHSLITRFKADTGKPVVAYFEDVAASGGYYVAAADRIVAQPTAITGSIGVIMSLMHIDGLMSKVGVASNVIISDKTPRKDIGSPYREMTDEERGLLKGIVETMFVRFVDIVDEGRTGLDRAAVERLATGMIYTGAEALANGLVDEVGYFDDAVTAARTAAGAPEAAVIELEADRGLLGSLLFGARGLLPPAAVRIPFAGLLETGGGQPLYLWLPGLAK
ncbi:MAG: signal peptide peptidase SppA [Planctomycetota bacterium]